ncbi:alanine:cation symporter family protein [Saccharopolyspora sp. NPDC000995]
MGVRDQAAGGGAGGLDAADDDGRPGHCVNFDPAPAALGEIISGAFTPEAGFGGMIGMLIVGFQRAAFSNEAGLGSAPIAHSAVYQAPGDRGPGRPAGAVDRPR